MIPLADLAWVLWQRGEPDEAAEVFEQLRAITGHRRVVTIGTENIDSLQDSLLDADDGFPFPILADPDCLTFKSYRAWETPAGLDW